MRRLALLLPLLTACASPELAQTDQAALAGDPICTTLDYGPRLPADQLYDFFTPPQADAYMRQLEATGYLKSSGGPDARYSEISSDPRINGFIRDAFTAMKAIYPSETAGLGQAPSVAVVASASRNAYVLPPGLVAGNTKAPWLFVIHAGLLSQPDDQVLGLIAHELGHLVLRNTAAEVRERITSFYLIPAAGEHGVFGARQPNDFAIRSHINDIVKRGNRIGFAPEQGLDTILGTYSGVLRGLSGACGSSALDALNAAQLPFQLPPSRVGAHRPVPSPAQLAELLRLSDTAITTLRQCFATSTETRSLAQLFPRLLPAELEADADPTLTTLPARLLYAEAKLRAELIGLRADPSMPFSRIRLYDSEQDSDDNAVRVLRSLGRDPLANGKFLLGILTPEARADCEAAVAAGDPIEFGTFFDPHGNHCWRYSRAADLAQALDQCR